MGDAAACCVDAGAAGGTIVNAFELASQILGARNQSEVIRHGSGMGCMEAEVWKGRIERVTISVVGLDS